MLKIIGLIKTLGWKHFLWKIWLLGKKRIGVETWFATSVSYDTVQPSGINTADYLKMLAGNGYWSGQQRNLIESVIKSLKLHVDQHKDIVKEILEYRITFFSHTAISLSALDFNYNPIEDIHVPPGRHSSQYFSFDPTIGDLKKVWELNRFQWANPLVTAYLLEETEDRRNEIRDYYEDAIVSWLSQCPHKRSVAWACSQEISIRCLNWLWAVWLLEIKKESILNPLLNAIYLSATHVFRQIDFARAQRNNHAITESVFLLFFARFFPHLPESAKYRIKGEEVLTECLRDQFFDDGGYIQNSHTYHRFALQSLCVVFPLIEHTELKVLLVQKMDASYHYLKAHIANEAGDFPNFGPNDGAMLFNFGGSLYRDMRPLLNNLSIILYGEPAYGEVLGMPDMLIHRLTGKNNPTKISPKKSLATTPFFIFPKSGQAILKDGAFTVFFRSADSRLPATSYTLIYGSTVKTY